LTKELEFGLASRSFRQDIVGFTNQSPCQNNDTNLTELQFSSISLSDVWPAGAQLVAGLIIALFLFGIELMVDHCSKRSRRVGSNG